VKESEAKQHSRSGEAGQGGLHSQSVVEFAIMLPVLLVILFILVDFGRVFYYQIALSNAAREGARLAADGTVPSDTVRLRVIDEAVGTIPLTTTDISVLPDDTVGYRTREYPVTVTVRYGFTAFTPMISSFWGGGALTLARSASMMVQ